MKLIPAKKENQNIKASILCSTYNQVNYISQTLDSFLTQNSAYNFEIIVHDDASTDGTQELLLEYQKQYPEKLTLLLQTENQYSKDTPFEPVLLEASQASGEVCFLCDGDDYWSDDSKLNTQIELLHSHSHIDMVFHPVHMLYPDNSKELFCQHSDKIWHVSASQVIKGTGGFCPTPSIAIRKAALQSLPSDVVKQMPVGDAFIQIYGALRGGALFLPEPMAVYRIHSENSVSKSLSNSDIKTQMAFNEDMAKTYQVIIKQTGFKHYLALRKMRNKYRFKKNRKLIKLASKH